MVRALGVDMDIFYRLASSAFGGSRMLERYSREMYAFLNGSQETSTEHGTINGLIEKLEIILGRARKLECPPYMGSNVLNTLLLAKSKGFGNSGPASVISVWTKDN